CDAGQEFCARPGNSESVPLRGEGKPPIAGSRADCGKSRHDICPAAATAASRLLLSRHHMVEPGGGGWSRRSARAVGPSAPVVEPFSDSSVNLSPRRLGKPVLSAAYSRGPNGSSQKHGRVL